MHEKTNNLGPTRSDINWAVQSQKQARSMKFWILEKEGLYYLCSKNKGADQLRGCLFSHATAHIVKLRESGV